MDTCNNLDKSQSHAVWENLVSKGYTLYMSPFIWHSWKDKAIVMENSSVFARDSRDYSLKEFFGMMELFYNWLW